MKRRDFLKKAGVGAAAVAATTVSAPFVHAAKKTTIKWRMQTYAGAALAYRGCFDTGVFTLADTHARPGRAGKP